MRQACSSFMTNFGSAPAAKRPLDAQNNPSVSTQGLSLNPYWYGEVFWEGTGSDSAAEALDVIASAGKVANRGKGEGEGEGEVEG